MKKSDKPENTRTMTVYAVIDTNVLVSALYSRKPDTAPFLILENLFDGNIVPMYNAEILAEYNEVLHRPKFPFSDKDIRLVLETITHCGYDSNRVSAEEICSDPKDVVFYEVAMSKEDSYLITGNKKHFPRVERVVTPREMLEILSLQI